jgi:D-sedoheptulose 7-phosphate isomerase
MIAVSRYPVAELFKEHAALIEACESIFDRIDDAAIHIVSALVAGNKILLCGNGGSAADAQHIAAELVGRFTADRPALPAIALHVNTSTLTAVANDFGYEFAFKREVEAFGSENDVLVAISTSGNSRNIIEAAKMAQEKNLRVIGLTGEDGGELKHTCDSWIGVPSRVTARIQEVHILIGHIWCHAIDQEFTGR